MGRPSRETEIREAALRCFARLGYDGTRVRHIADEAGVSEAALYRHWKSKEELAAAVFSDGMRAYAAELAEAAGGDGPVEERLVRLVERMLDLYRDRPHLTVFLLEQQARFIDALPPAFPYPLHVVEQLVSAGQRDRSVRRGDRRLLAAIALGCVTRPILVSRHSHQWSFDPGSRAHRKLIAGGAWDAIRAR
jgi:AcrR family transcriptional regulator